jgi:predicted transporter
VAILIALVVYAALLPPGFWTKLWEVRPLAHVLVAMLLLFCGIALSLIWSAGQRIDEAVFSFFNMRAGGAGG